MDRRSTRIAYYKKKRRNTRIYSRRRKQIWHLQSLVIASPLSLSLVFHRPAQATTHGSYCCCHKCSSLSLTLVFWHSSAACLGSESIAYLQANDGRRINKFDLPQPPFFTSALIRCQPIKRVVSHVNPCGQAPQKSWWRSFAIFFLMLLFMKTLREPLLFIFCRCRIWIFLSNFHIQSKST